MALQCSSVLFLVSCAVLTQTLASIINTDQDRPEAPPGLSDPVPACAADYANMDRKQPKLNLKAISYPSGICVKSDGDFVASVWATRKFVYMFNSCGWIKKRIELPRGTSWSTDCAFTDTHMYYAVTRSQKILQYNINGTYQRDFTTGFNFLRLTTRGNELYTTIESRKDIRVYDTRNGNILRHFSTTSRYARGLAFDRSGFLHVSTYSNKIELFTADGHKFRETTYKDLRTGDGLVIDGNYYTIITDRGHRQLQVYNHENVLVKKVTGFSNPWDVAMGYKCGYVLLADYSAHSIYLL